MLPLGWAQPCRGCGRRTCRALWSRRRPFRLGVVAILAGLTVPIRRDVTKVPGASAPGFRGEAEEEPVRDLIDVLTGVLAGQCRDCERANCGEGGWPDVVADVVVAVGHVDEAVGDGVDPVGEQRLTPLRARSDHAIEAQSQAGSGPPTSSIRSWLSPVRIACTPSTAWPPTAGHDAASCCTCAGQRLIWRRARSP